MATLQAQLNKAKTLNSENLATLLFEFIRSIESKIKDINEEQIFKFSSDIYGKALGFYSKATERITTEEWEAGLRKESEIKEAGTPFTLKDKGTFLDLLYAKVSPSQKIITFGSSDPKTGEVLENLLSKSIFGLTDENLQNFIKTDLLPFYQNLARKQIGI